MTWHDKHPHKPAWHRWTARTAEPQGAAQHAVALSWRLHTGISSLDALLLSASLRLPMARRIQKRYPRPSQGVKMRLHFHQRKGVQSFLCCKSHRKSSSSPAKTPSYRERFRELANSPKTRSTSAPSACNGQSPAGPNENGRKANTPKSKKVLACAQASAIRGGPHVARRHAAVPHALQLRVALDDWVRNDVHERARA